MYYTRCQKHLDQARKNNQAYKKRHFIKGTMEFKPKLPKTFGEIKNV